MYAFISICHADDVLTSDFFYRRRFLGYGVVLVDMIDAVTKDEVDNAQYQ